MDHIAPVDTPPVSDTPLVSDPDRLATLRGYAILDTGPEPGFDDAVQLATLICEAPVALVSLVSHDRQWFKARIDFPMGETDLDASVCVHALSVPDLLIIDDLTQDPRTASNPLVTGPPGIRFYAGAPLRTPDGVVLGTLCVIDREPRPGGLTPNQASALRSLARQVMGQLELRRAMVAQDALLAARRQAETELKASEAYWRGLFHRFSEGFVVGEVLRDAAGRVTDWRYIDVNAAFGALVGLDPASVMGRTVRQVFPGIEDDWVDDFAEVVETGEGRTFTRQIGAIRRWYEGRAFRLGPERFAVLFFETTARVGAEARSTALLALGDRLRDLVTIPAMTRAASAIVGETLDVARVGFGRLSADLDVIDVEPDWTVAGVASLTGRHRFNDYGRLRPKLERGEPLAIADVRTDPHTRDDPSPLLSLGIGSMVNVPIRERGRVVAMFFVHDLHPRAWSAEEMAFLANVADRVEVGVARLQAEDQQRILNDELSHRLKNTLAMVQAIATQTLKGIPQRDAVDAFIQRLAALGRAHEVLLQQDWATAPMRAVVERTLDLHTVLGRFAIAGPDLSLGPKAVLSLTLLLHELATNAIKYGALSRDAGGVGLTWAVAPEGGGTLVMSWQERGGPPVTAPTRRGLGSRLIGMGLAGTGESALDYRVDGLRAEFRAPLAMLNDPSSGAD